MKSGEKPKLAIYWGASCGGCEIAILNLHEKFLALDQLVDIVFCPCIMDTKKKDIEELPDGAIDVTLFNGALRTGENVEMAHLLRRKSRLLLAFGSCARGGCIPGLANLSTVEELMQSVYLNTPAIDNPGQLLPAGEGDAAGEDTRLTPLLRRVKQLADEVETDCSIPGCPPEPHQIWEAIGNILSGRLPERGGVAGCGELTVCDECDRIKGDKKIRGFRRNYEFSPDPGTCLLEQGMLCMGVATRSGCGAPCMKANMPCTGCYGAPEGVSDQGGKMIAALGSVIDIGDTAECAEEEINRKIDEFLKVIPDYAGLFYKYTLAASTLGGRVGR